jgi:hypothetical protein
MLVFLFLRAIILRGDNNGAVGRCDRIGRVSSFVRLHVVRAEFEWRDLETMSVPRDFSLAFSHYQFTCTVSRSCYFFYFIILHYYTL